MDRQEFIRALFARAKEVGFEDCEVFLSESEVFSTGVFKGEIIDYSASSGFGLGFRGLFGGRMGYASTQVLDAAAVEQLVRGAMENAQMIDEDDPEGLYPGSPAIAAPRTGNPALGEITPAEKIEMARELERRTLARDPRMAQVDSCSVASEDSRVRIVNTLGLDVSESANCIGAFVSAIARDGDRAGTGTGYRFVLDREALDLGAIAAEAADAVADMVFLAPAEKDPGGIIESEIVHGSCSPCLCHVTGETAVFEAARPPAGEKKGLICCVCRDGAGWIGRAAGGVRERQAGQGRPEGGRFSVPVVCSACSRGKPEGSGSRFSLPCRL